MQLTDVAEKSLEGLQQLRQLRLENNKICSLSPYDFFFSQLLIFRNALNETKQILELLDMSGNCLTSVPAQNLRNSARLMYLDMSDNKISEVCFNVYMMISFVGEQFRTNESAAAKGD